MTERERRIWWHWSNENYRPGDRTEATGHPFWNGRAWLHVFDSCFHLQWVFGKVMLGVSLDLNSGEREVGWTLKVPLMQLYGSFEGKPTEPLFRLLGMDYAACKARAEKNGGYAYQDMHREFGLRVHDWALWWDCWSRWGHWSSKDPKWMQGSWHPLDTFFGRPKHSAELIATRAVVVPMPEAQYAGTAEVTRDTWTRPRWPWWPSKLVLQRVKIEVPEGIPIPGKGENSYDCGPDATYSSSGPARSIEEAIGNLVTSSLETRRRRGAPQDYAERPEPRERDPNEPGPAAAAAEEHR